MVLYLSLISRRKGGGRGPPHWPVGVLLLPHHYCQICLSALSECLRLEAFPLNPTKAVVILSSHGKSCQRSPIPAEVLSTTSYQVAIRLTLSLTLNWSHRMKRSDYDGARNYDPLHSPDHHRIIMFWLSLMAGCLTKLTQRKPSIENGMKRNKK